MKFEFQEKVVVITGAGRGLGREMALAFAGAGAYVVVNDLCGDRCRAVAEEITARGGKALAEPCDVADSGAVAEMFADIMAKAGRVDVLVNNAVYVPAPEKQVSLHETENEEWVRGIQVNINGVFYCSQQAGRSMKEQGRGRIINITSDMGFAPSPKMGVVAAGKAGVFQLTRVMAEELGDFGITVNAVAPGVIESDETKEKLDSEAGRQYLGYVPGHRFGRPEEVTAAVLFLASDEASYISGNQLMVDGGWSTGFSRDF